MRDDRDYSRTFYVTKYATTTGILQVKGCVVPDSTDIHGKVIHAYGGKMLEAPTSGSFNSSTYYHKPDWHESLDDAKARAVEMAKAKLKSLDKQRAKLERLAGGDRQRTRKRCRGR